MELISAKLITFGDSQWASIHTDYIDDSVAILLSGDIFSKCNKLDEMVQTIGGGL